MGFEVDTPDKGQQHAHHMRLSCKDLAKKLLTNRKNLKVAKDGHMSFSFHGYLLQTPCQSDQY